MENVKGLKLDGSPIMKAMLTDAPFEYELWVATEGNVSLVWEMRKHYYRTGWQERGTEFIMDNPFFHHLWMEKPEELEEALKRGDIDWGGFNGGVTPEGLKLDELQPYLEKCLISAFCKGEHPGLWSSLGQRWLHIEPVDAFADVIPLAFDEPYQKSAKGLYELWLKYAKPRGYWTYKPGEFKTKKDLFKPEELEKYGLTPETAKNRTAVKKAVPPKRYSEYCRDILAGYLNQRHCNIPFGARELLYLQA